MAAAQSEQLLRQARVLAAHENAILDVTAGLAPPFYLQAGTTAMLAGVPIRAEAWLRRASLGFAGLRCDLRRVDFGMLLPKDGLDDAYPSASSNRILR